ncbi:MAG: hypothetical protein AAF211_17375, partial [Myxococcota bacterium]
TDLEGDDALAALIEYVVTPSGLTEDDVTAWNVGLLDEGTRLQPALAASEPVSADTVETFFLLDQSAGARWPHDVDWAFIDSDGQARVEPQTSFPALDGLEWLPSEHAPVWGTRFSEPVPREPPSPLFQPGVVVLDPNRDRCRRDDPSLAFGIGATRTLGAMHELEGFSRMIDRRYAAADLVTVSPPTDDVSMPLTMAAIQTRFDAQIGVREQWNEVLIVIVGNATVDGRLVLGDAPRAPTVTPAQLGGMLGSIQQAERVVVVLSMGYAGGFATELGAWLESEEVAYDVVIHAASAADEPAWVPESQLGSTFGLAVVDAFEDAPLGEPLDWPSLALPTLTTEYPGQVERQTPRVITVDRRQPFIGLSQNPNDEGRCHAARHQGHDDNPNRDYDRVATLQGSFGNEGGRVEMQSDRGVWKTIPHTFWSREEIVFTLPMRRDGFPAIRHSPEGIDQLAAPADNEVRPGLYLVRVVRGDGDSPLDISLPQPIRLLVQGHVSVLEPSSGTAWLEQWNPLSPAPEGLQGPTIQFSATWSPDLGDDPLSDPFFYLLLDSDIDQPHVTDPVLSKQGDWVYELAPGPLDPATAFAIPEVGVEYWGYRVAFGDPPNIATEYEWRFTLLYD